MPSGAFGGVAAPARAVTEPIMDAQQCHFWQIGEYSAASDKTTTSVLTLEEIKWANQIQMYAVLY